MLLTDAADKFLASRRQLLVLLGEAGSGKSTFMWQLCKRLLAASPTSLLDVPVSRMPTLMTPLYLPVYVELKRYKADGLAGLLDRALLSAGLSREAVQALRGQDTAAPLVRVLLLADGYDELQGDVSAVEDFVRTACVDWYPALLAVIVTSRESRVGDRTRERSVFGEHDRALLLPFTKDRVRVCTLLLSWLQGLCSTAVE
jgi:predicted Ser/Thr protein kinase